MITMYFEIEKKQEVMLQKFEGQGLNTQRFARVTRGWGILTVKPSFGF